MSIFQESFFEGVRFATGSFVGTNTKNHKINLNFTPKIVFLFGPINQGGASAYFTENGEGYFTSSGGAGNAGTLTHFEIVENGFIVHKLYNWFNESSITTTYLAIGERS